MYEAFAAVYDRLMDDVEYPRWAALYARRLGLAPGAHIAECGCGTGNMTLALAALGYRLTGLDLSAQMLSIAMEKARASGHSIPFIRQDMRRLSLHKPVDAVIAPVDGVNYLHTGEVARAFFAAAAGALRPGGALAFDISSRHKLLHGLAGQFYGEDRGDLCYLWQNRLLPGDLVELDLTFFQQEPDGRYMRFDETQRQRAWQPTDLERLLRECGFDGIEWLDAAEKPPAPEADRIFCFARKR